MTTLFHALEHVSALIGLLVLLLFAWALVKLRHYRISEAEKDRLRRHYATRRPLWMESTPGDADEEYRRVQ